MDFRRKIRPQRTERKPEYENLEQQYPHNVSLYRQPPSGDIKLKEFEDLATDRLTVLRILEQANTKGLRYLSDEWKEYVNAELSREGLRGYLRLCTSTTSAASSHSEAKREADLQARRRDHISHFILRLAFCRTEEMRRWFLARELELFKYKFAALNSAEIKQFLERNKLNYAPLTEEQKNEVKDGLYDSTPAHSVSQIELLDFYKVPFEQVIDVVSKRRCYMKKGYAYITMHDFVSVVALKLSNIIEKGLQSARGMSRQVEADERVFHLLQSLHTSNTGKDYTLNKDSAVPIESLDQLAKKSFPLCMRVCHEHLRANHHMKYFGRMQYGLFLKGIGVTLADALRFWREEFTKKMDGEKFAKSYEYNIYHNYGKKGSMVNYTPYSCLKIIGENMAPGDVHGCPYKSYDQQTLKSKLAANGLAAGHVQEVAALAAKGHFQLACGKYFQILHNSNVEVAINHPNQYFEESQALMGVRQEKKGEKPMVRKAPKRSANETMPADDDADLWKVAETQETAYRSQQAEQMAWDEDLDLSAIEY